MRVLVTCDRYLAPRHEGLVLRVIHYVKRLQQRHQFDFLCLDRTPDLHDPATDVLFGRVVRVPYGGRQAQTGLSRWTAAFDVDDLYPRSEAAQAQIARLLEEEQYQLIWDAGANMMANLKLARERLPLLADQVDDVFLMLRRQLALAVGLRQRVWLGKQLWLQQRFARSYLENAEAVLFVSPLDEASFRRECPEAETVTIANGVDEAFFAPGVVSPAPGNRSELVFEGVMQFGPNVDAMTFFVSEVLGLIKRRHPSVRLAIVGRDPVPEVQALAGSFVRVTGFVEDIRPWLSGAKVFVCPMRGGAGIKNKILQAWAMGLPVVSTPEGAHGLDARDGENILVRGTPKAFAQAVCALLTSPAERERIGAAGRATVCAQYSWEKKACELEQLFARAVAKRGLRTG